LRVIYRIHVVGGIPGRDGVGALLLPNHVSFIDAVLIGASAGTRWVRFVIFREFFDRPMIGPIVRFFDAVPVSSTRVKEALKTTAKALQEGSLVCLFPEGQLTRHGLLNPLKKGFELMARGAGVPVVPVWLDNVWGSIFSFERGKFFRKRPQRVPYHAAVHFGKAISPEHATVEAVERGLRELSANALAGRAELRSSLDFELVEALRKRSRKPCLIEGDRVWTRGEVLAIGEALAARWSHLCRSRVRVDLSFGVPAALANIGLVLAGRIPVNTTRPPESGEAVVDAEEFAAAIAEADGLRRRVRAATAWWPVDWFRQRVPADGDAVAIERAAFTHRSLLAQVEQLAGTNLVSPAGRIVTDEPLHTAAGSLIGLWFPLLRGIPVEFVRDNIPESQAVMNRRTDRVSADPREPPAGVWLGSGVARAGFFNLRPNENFLVLDDVPAVVTISQPDPPLATSTSDPQSGGRTGSLGRLLTGFAVSFDDKSRLSIRGPSLPQNEHEFLDTGIRVRADDDGLLVRG
jgi:acyl-[acyl-carrier-protein]-phospholipid O-acyltransferase/long-chain-fatty-acid--[acyl-carrier-protein] ligase